MRIREAGPKDVKGIVSVHISNASVWYNSKGKPTKRSYKFLSPYERWLSGGPWMDEGLCEKHLKNLIAVGGIALVAEKTGKIIGEAEIISSAEREGNALHISILYVHKDCQGKGVARRLLEAISERAQANEQDIPVWFWTRHHDDWATHYLRQGGISSPHEFIIYPWHSRTISRPYQLIAPPARQSCCRKPRLLP
ncbi:MAG: GNAT family N-acetyltransferase [candidate division WOR-3 bacterium]